MTELDSDWLATTADHLVLGKYQRRPQSSNFASIREPGNIPGDGIIHVGHVGQGAVDNWGVRGHMGVSRRQSGNVYVIIRGGRAVITYHDRPGVSPAGMVRLRGSQSVTPRIEPQDRNASSAESFQIISSDPPGVIRVFFGKSGDYSRSKPGGPPRGFRGYNVHEHELVQDELTSALMRGHWLGLRLLAALRVSGPTSASEIISSISKAESDIFTRALVKMRPILPEAQIDLVIPILAELKDAGAVEMGTTGKFYSTSLGRTIVQSIEGKTGLNLQSQIDEDEAQNILERVVPEVAKEVQSLGRSRPRATQAAPLSPAHEPPPATKTAEADDMNYAAYMKEVHYLFERYGRGIVAYANGKFVAWGRNARELAKEINESDYPRDKALFIKNVPEEDEEFNPAFEDA